MFRGQSRRLRACKLPSQEEHVHVQRQERIMTERAALPTESTVDCVLGCGKNVSPRLASAAVALNFTRRSSARSDWFFSCCARSTSSSSELEEDSANQSHLRLCYFHCFFVMDGFLNQAMVEFRHISFFRCVVRSLLMWFLLRFSAFADIRSFKFLWASGDRHSCRFHRAPPVRHGIERTTPISEVCVEDQRSP